MQPTDTDPTPRPATGEGREPHPALPEIGHLASGPLGQPYQAPLGPVTVPGPARRRLPVVGIALAIIMILGGGGLFMAGYTFGHRQAETPGTPVDQEQAFAPFWDAYHAIIRRYAGGEVDHQKLIEGAIRGMIESLDDPYSSYLTPDEYRESLQGISGQFEGIGAEIGTQTSDGS
jgi:hypothetical protein